MNMATWSQHICLSEKNPKTNIYTILLCEGLVCMKVAKKPVIFHALQQIFLTLLFTYYWFVMFGHLFVGEILQAYFIFFWLCLKSLPKSSLFSRINTLCSFHPVEKCYIMIIQNTNITLSEVSSAGFFRISSPEWMILSTSFTLETLFFLFYD